ncbi:MAG: class I SAM-dependent methyltransferase [Microthrixaceae bacterium]
MQDSTRIARETEFHDQRFGSEEQRSSNRFYAITGDSARAYRDAVARIPSSAEVLEIGCGDNAEAWDLAGRGLSVTSIDISPVAVEAARSRAADEGLTRLRFEEMNAEALTFADGSFDAVIGSGILHHLDLALGVPEVARVLRPGGVAVFLEPLGLNPALRAYRRVTPGERTPDEHPLLRADLRFLERWFEQVDLQFFHLASLAAIPLLKTDLFDRALGTLGRVDQRLLRSSQLAQDLAWFVTIELRGPKALKTP